jgi:hypothetical protein
MLGVGVFFEIFFVEGEDHSDDCGIVLEANIGNEIGNDIEEAMSVDKGKSGGGSGGVRQICVGAFSHVFDNVSEKLKLVHQMRKLGSLNLGEFRLEHRETV